MPRSHPPKGISVNDWPYGWFYNEHDNTISFTTGARISVYEYLKYKNRFKMGIFPGNLNWEYYSGDDAGPIKDLINSPVVVQNLNCNGNFLMSLKGCPRSSHQLRLEHCGLKNINELRYVGCKSLYLRKNPIKRMTFLPQDCEHVVFSEHTRALDVINLVKRNKIDFYFHNSEVGVIIQTHIEEDTSLIECINELMNVETQYPINFES